MKVLLSVKPEFAEKILSGEKKYEFRKCLPRQKNVHIVLIYATMPVGKIVGEFYIDRFIKDTPKNLWVETKEHAGITKLYFDEYFHGRKVACAIAIKSVKRYRKEIELRAVLPNALAPQSFCYVRTSETGMD